MASSGAEDSDEEALSSNLFQEPKDYYQPEKPATFTEYALQDGAIIKLRLVGHSPLWGHLLWNAGQVIAQYLEAHASLVQDGTVLELGAGAGLPSLVSAILGARKVVMTDYPDAELIDNLRYNIEHCQLLPSKTAITAEGFIWGNSVSPLTAHLESGGETFDVLILADILFNHSEHQKLLATVQTTLKKSASARALVFFTPYRPWLLDKDLDFFELARVGGLHVNKIMEYTMDKVMFENDRGDEMLRRTVFGYELSWPTE